MARLKIEGLHKRYGSTPAVRGVDLDIPEGEFAVLVGPSGCGKSTLLRTIAGLEDADEGTVAIDGEVVNDMRPRDRDVAMVFQNYALYPYMNVYDNIAFGLRARKTPEDAVAARVREAAGLLGLEPLLQRKPRELSGGQRQRVAIGRAIVREARLYLFDEPLSNLDAQLREEMRAEIKRLHQDIGKTMVYVTHDQIEAMTLADRIVLLRDGQIEQQGAPLDLFEHPRTRFVAGFLGSPAMNFLPASISATDGVARVELGDGLSLPVPGERGTRLANENDREVVVGIRPEHLSAARSDDARAGLARFTTIIELIQPTGSRTYGTFSIGGKAVVAELLAHDIETPGTQLELQVDMNRVVLIDPRTDIVI